MLKLLRADMRRTDPARDAGAGPGAIITLELHDDGDGGELAHCGGEVGQRVAPAVEAGLTAWRGSKECRSHEGVAQALRQAGDRGAELGREAAELEREWEAAVGGGAFPPDLAERTRRVKDEMRFVEERVSALRAKEGPARAASREALARCLKESLRRLFEEQNRAHNAEEGALVKAVVPAFARLAVAQWTMALASDPDHLRALVNEHGPSDADVRAA